MWRLLLWHVPRALQSPLRRVVRLGARAGPRRRWTAAPKGANQWARDGVDASAAVVSVAARSERGPGDRAARRPARAGGGAPTGRGRPPAQGERPAHGGRGPGTGRRARRV